MGEDCRAGEGGVAGRLDFSAGCAKTSAEVETLQKESREVGGEEGRRGENEVDPKGGGEGKSLQALLAERKSLECEVRDGEAKLRQLRLVRACQSKVRLGTAYIYWRGHCIYIIPCSGLFSGVQKACDVT